MRACVCLNALYKLLHNESRYLFQYALYIVTKVRAGMILIALNMILLI